MVPLALTDGTARLAARGTWGAHGVLLTLAERARLRRADTSGRKEFRARAYQSRRGAGWMVGSVDPWIASISRSASATPAGVSWTSRVTLQR